MKLLEEIAEWCYNQSGQIIDLVEKYWMWMLGGLLVIFALMIKGLLGI